MKAIAIVGPVWTLILALFVGSGARDTASAATPRYTLAWTQRTDVGSPGPRYGHALAYDSDRGVTVFFGGEYSLPGGDPEYFNDTWEYDGVSWKQIVIEGPVPEPRSRHAMCYDNVLKRVILFGGQGGSFSDVWNYESIGPQRGRWIRRIMAGGPGPLAAHTMVFDYFLGRAIVAGGSPPPARIFESQTRQTWALDNSLGQWSLLDLGDSGDSYTPLPQELTAHMMLYDYRRREVVVLGGFGHWGVQKVSNRRIFVLTRGSSGVSDVFAKLCGSRALEGSIVYDGFHDIYIEFGGNNYLYTDDHPLVISPNYGKVWYRGVEGFPCGYVPKDVRVWWVEEEPRVRPAIRAQTAMIYDEKRRVTVLFGGVGGTRYGGTWEVVTHDGLEIWVDFSHQGRELGTFEFPYRTLAQGIRSVVAGGTLKIKSGSTSETLNLNRPMNIEAFGGQVSIGRP